MVPKLGILLHRLWVTGEIYEPLYNVNLQQQRKKVAAWSLFQKYVARVSGGSVGLQAHESGPCQKWPLGPARSNSILETRCSQIGLVAKSSSSGDCGTSKERRLLETEVFQFGSEMAAPVEIEDTSWHRSKSLHQECGWKRGDSTMANVGREASTLGATRSIRFIQMRTKYLIY